MQSKALKCDLYCIHTKKLSRLKSGEDFDVNDMFYEFKYLHHFWDRLTFGVNAVLALDLSQWPIEIFNIPFLLQSSEQ